MKKYLLEITVFLVGGVIMILEIVGSRVLAPYVGTSIYVWTSLIGIILGSLSLGYYLGGRLADKKPTFQILSLIIFFSAVSILLLTLTKNLFPSFLLIHYSDLRMTSTVSALILFFMPSMLLGMVSPYALKLKMKNLSSSGTTAGNLYALSTVGSILGTFITGFYLMAFLGDTLILLLLVGILLLLSLFITLDDKKELKVFCLIIFGISIIQSDLIKYLGISPGTIITDTVYNKVLVFDDQDSQGQKVRRMNVNNEQGSAMFLEKDDLVYDYTKYYRLAAFFKPDLKTSLMIGGAGYSYPKDFLKSFPQATMDVVEIDPGLTKLAKQYFRLEGYPHLTIYHEDGRTFLNKNIKKYDAIFIDAFRSYSVPYQLTTTEAIERIYESLNDKGFVLINIISAIDGEKGKFFKAEYATYQKLFPQVYAFLVSNPQNSFEVQNIMILALKSDNKPIFSSNKSEFDNYLNHRWQGKINLDIPVLTDNFCPVDQYLMEIL